MLIRIKHPDHGFTHVYDVTELKAHQELGWEQDLPEEPNEANESDPEKRGPGRPKKVE